ncbi:MAG TPA: FoF1 ATP synthase subunit a [Coriobacteriia bacterium]|nr:FoF1 ATP synthase subunit a [Coriobacteriia bacterium]
MTGLAITSEAIVVMTGALVASGVLIGLGFWFSRIVLSVDEPSKRQSAGEFVLAFFVNKAREIAHGENRQRIIETVAPLLATFFLFIFVCNLIGVLPIPVFNRPPTSHFSVTLSLAMCSVIGTLLAAAAFKGPLATLKHLVWPNPMQWVSEVTDVMSLSLRLFGNIAGEFMTVTLVMQVVPYGIPLILHALGLIPAFVQALVFTLLTSSFIADALHEQKRRPKRTKAGQPVDAMPSTTHAEGGFAQ